MNSDSDTRHICCTICRIPIQSPETKLYYCACNTIICEFCEKIRTCPGCTLGHGLLKRVYLVFKDEVEQDRIVKDHLNDTYFTSGILIEQHDQLMQEIQMCRNVSERLKKAVEAVQQAADLAKRQRADIIAKQGRRVAQLESLRALVRKKEEELHDLQRGKRAN